MLIIHCNQQEMKKFCGLANEILLEMAIKPTGKSVQLILGTTNWIYQKQIKFTIEIENQNELFYANRDALRAKISSIVAQSVKAAKKILLKRHSLKIKQYFQFSKRYSV